MQHAALLQVLDQAGDRLVRRRGRGAVGLHVAVGVPAAVAAAGVADLDEADALLGEAAGQQKLVAELVGLLLADAVEILDVLRARSRNRRPPGRSAACGRPVRRPSTRAAMSELSA